MMKFLVILAVATLTSGQQYFGDYACDGEKDVMVHLFEWKWSDIESNCQNLADIGYCAVQVSPPNEHVVITSPPYPWWQRYQPVSYIVSSRSGDEAAFQSMVTACNAVGVKIYVDAVINHMTGSGEGIGSAGSYWNAGSDLDNEGQDYPAVPYTAADFNGDDVCTTASGTVEDYYDAAQVRDCRLYGLRDLRLSAAHPRDTVRAYMQKLVDWGVAGFRADATKHMYPQEVSGIYDGLTGSPFIFQEVIDLSDEPITAFDYTSIARVTEFKFGEDVSQSIRGNGRTMADLATIGQDPDYLPADRAVVFIDNHDSQRGGIAGTDPLTHMMMADYNMAQAFMLAYNYGYPRVMSSFHFDMMNGTDAGPPSDGNGNTNDVVCGEGWICEHSWPVIASMVHFHNEMHDEPVANWWDNGNQAIAFSRGDHGFVVMNKEVSAITETFQTGLPAGDYCDIISCDTMEPPCTGAECQGAVTVDASGFATITVSNTDEYPMRAYHVHAHH